MKSYLLVALLLILLLPNLFGEIRNGYERDLPNLRTSLQNLKDLLANDADLTDGERRKLKQKITSLMDLMVYSELTVKLLNQFKAIAPDLYNEIDTLKDSKGRVIDVYVKFIPKDEATFESPGMVSFVQSSGDENGCSSAYGDGTVSVMIMIMNNSLQVLSHEFGHLQYMVPNLTSYVDYYRRTYGRGLSLDRLGHRVDDPSGDNALDFQNRYRRSYIRYRHEGDQIVSPYMLANRTRRNVFREPDEAMMSLVMNGW